MKNITALFLKLNPGVLFLFIIMSSFNWYSSSLPVPVVLISVINFIGQMGLLIWLYSICEKSAEVLKENNIDFNTIRTYKYALTVILIADLLFLILINMDPLTLSTQSDIERGEAFTYKRIFLIIGLAMSIGILFTYRNTLKLLSSAEHGQEQSFSGYYKSFLLLLFLPWIAVWFIQLRVRKI